MTAALAWIAMLVAAWIFVRRGLRQSQRRPRPGRFDQPYGTRTSFTEKRLKEK